MPELLLAVDILLVVLGVVMLLYGYRVIGKSPGADKQYDSVMAHKGVIYKACGWCGIVAGIIGLGGYLTGIV